MAKDLIEYITIEEAVNKVAKMQECSVSRARDILVAAIELLRLRVLPFCLREKRLLLPPYGSLDALFVRETSSLMNRRDTADATSQDVTLA